MTQPARIQNAGDAAGATRAAVATIATRSEEHTSELQSPSNLVCRLLLEKKNRSESDAAHAAAHRGAECRERIASARQIIGTVGAGPRDTRRADRARLEVAAAYRDAAHADLRQRQAAARRDRRAARRAGAGAGAEE